MKTIVFEVDVDTDDNVTLEQIAKSVKDKHEFAAVRPWPSPNDYLVAKVRGLWKLITA